MLFYLLDHGPAPQNEYLPFFSEGEGLFHAEVPRDARVRDYPERNLVGERQSVVGTNNAGLPSPGHSAGQNDK